MKLRVGVIGLGSRWEDRYRGALAALSERFELRAVFDQVALLADRHAQPSEVVISQGYQALLAREDIDVVWVLSCGWLGPLPVLAACDRGKAIFAGGNLDWSPDDLLTVRQRVQQSGVAFLAEFPRRYAAATIRLMELIATRLGPPQLLFCHDQERKPAHPAERNVSHEAMPRSLVESVDWCRYVVGSEPSSVVGVCHPGTNTPQHGSYRMLSLDFSRQGGMGQGPMAQISYGSYIPTAWTEAASFHAPSQLQVCCERGVAFLDLPSTLIWFDEAGRHIESLESERSPVEALLMRLHRAVTSLVQVTSDLDDACRAHEIVRQACRSAYTGTRVCL